MSIIKKMQSQVNNLDGVFVTPNNEVFFVDWNNNRVRKLLNTGETVTIAGTGKTGYNGDDIPATDANLNHPTSIFVSSRNEVYFSEATFDEAVIVIINKAGQWSFLNPNANYNVGKARASMVRSAQSGEQLEIAITIWWLSPVVTTLALLLLHWNKVLCKNFLLKGFEIVQFLTFQTPLDSAHLGCRGSEYVLDN